MLFLSPMNLLDFALVLACLARVTLALQTADLGAELMETFETIRRNLSPIDGLCNGAARLPLVAAIAKAAAGGQSGDLGERLIDRAGLRP